MQVNDGGTTSFFAVLRKSSSDQKSRIQKSAEKKVNIHLRRRVMKFGRTARSSWDNMWIISCKSKN